MKLGIVVPTYNEAATIGPLVKKLVEYGDVLVVDDGTDNTAEIARAAGASVLKREGKQGIGSAIRLGMCVFSRTSVDHVIVIDAGGTHRPDMIPYMVYPDEPLVIGSRFRSIPRPLKYRTVISLVAAWLARLVLRTCVRDCTSGYRCYRMDAVQHILKHSTANGFAVQIEMLGLVWKEFGRVLEVWIPYKLTNSTFRFSMVWEALRVLARLARRRGACSGTI